MADRNTDDHMIAEPSRTVEVILDAKSSARLMARGPEFYLDVVKERFREHLRPAIAKELTVRRGVKWLKLAARVVAGVVRLMRPG